MTHVYADNAPLYVEADLNPGLESGPEGEPQGADPRYLPVKGFESLGHVPKPLLKIIRLSVEKPPLSGGGWDFSS